MSDPLKVQQTDRDAAAELERDGRERDQILRGKRDRSHHVQTMARYRIRLPAPPGTTRAPADLRSALEAETIKRSDTDEEIISAFDLTKHYGPREIEALFRSIRAFAPTKGDVS